MLQKRDNDMAQEPVVMMDSSAYIHFFSLMLSLLLPPKVYHRVRFLTQKQTQVPHSKTNTCADKIMTGYSAFICKTAMLRPQNLNTKN
jgi:hypothetical protein